MHQHKDIIRIDLSGASRAERDRVAVEEPLEVRVRGRAVSVTLRTPGHDAELVAGFLLSEGLIRTATDLLNVEPCERDDRGQVVNATLAADVHVDFEKLTRHVFASSSCGMCGKATIDAIHLQFPPITDADRPSIPLDVLTALPDAMRRQQTTFESTGGLHAASLFDSNGQMLVLREDVGRHNAVDKVIGFALFSGRLPLDDHLMLVSGRASFEIMQKALAAGLPVVAAVSAPSSLAVDFAEASRQTLIGFLARRE